MNYHAKQIETSRLLLRGLQLTDGTILAALRSDAQVNKYLDRQACINVQEAEAFICKIQDSVANGLSYYWAICLKDDPDLVGTICLWNIDRENAQAELGYELLPAFQGKGIMLEAVQKVLAMAFSQLNFKTIGAVTHRDNARSVTLLEKNGFLAGHPAEHNDLAEDELYFTLCRG